MSDKQIVDRMQPSARERTETVLRPYHSKSAAVRKLIEQAYLDGYAAGREKAERWARNLTDG